MKNCYCLIAFRGGSSGSRTGYPAAISNRSRHAMIHAFKVQRRSAVVRARAGQRSGGIGLWSALMSTGRATASLAGHTGDLTARRGDLVRIKADATGSRLPLCGARCRLSCGFLSPGADEGRVWIRRALRECSALPARVPERHLLDLAQPDHVAARGHPSTIPPLLHPGLPPSGGVIALEEVEEMARTQPPSTRRPCSGSPSPRPAARRGHSLTPRHRRVPGQQLRTGFVQVDDSLSSWMSAGSRVGCHSVRSG